MLRARLLGELQLELDGTAIASPVTQRPWVLFSYIALAPRPVPRAELAAALWPDVHERSARASLRSTLWALRRQVGDALVVEADHLGLDRSRGLWIDVHEFERLAAAEPARALELCRGDLLEGLSEEWAFAARERHRGRVVELLEQQAQVRVAAQELRAAIELTRRQVEWDPFDEPAHRRLIARLDAAGDRAAALQAYRSLSERLQRVLGVVPSELTREQARSLRADAPRRRAASPALGLPPLVGRERELDGLAGVWGAVAGGDGTVAAVHGAAGTGKTRLVLEVVRLARESGALTAGSGALDLGGRVPFSLWTELIRELLAQLSAPAPDVAWPDDLTTLVSALPPHFKRPSRTGVVAAPELRRTRLFDAVVALLTWAADEAPLLLVLEDIHAADGPSLELAGYAARHLGGLRVLMLLTTRDRPPSAGADRLQRALRSRGLLAAEFELGPLVPARATSV